MTELRGDALPLINRDFIVMLCLLFGGKGDSCPSCDECQTINDKMFKYNDNKQAYITDVKLGTYRQLVEAAEACQVSIIHPGKPWNPDEPGLPELVARAESFR